MKFYVIPLLLLLSPLNSRALDIEVTNKDQRIKNLVTDVLGLLPVEMKKAIPGKIKLKVGALDSFPSLQDPCQKKEKHQIYGLFKNNTITLNQNFLPYLGKDGKGEDFACGHRNFKKLAQATLIHELAHAYDSVKNVSASELYKGLQSKNRAVTRLPDPYELTNSFEHFAVNMEFFLLDKTYSCRRPVLANFFTEHFRTPPASCRLNYRIPLFDGNKMTEAILDPKDVAGIHYLLADKGDPMMSRFGHAMYRIVFHDKSKDLVVGFSGEMDGLLVNGVDGMTGKYASRVLVSPFQKILNSYTRDEFRGLTSYPISFDEKEKERFLLQILTLYWEYQGNYYFLSNNCATEALNLLAVTLDQSLPLSHNPIISPKEVRDAIEREGLLQAGEYFPSYKLQLERAFENLKESAQKKDLKTYLKSKLAERKNLFKRLREKKQYFSLLLIEIFIAENLGRKIEGLMMEKINKLPEDHSVRKTALRVVELNNEFSFGAVQQQGYGIPLKSEFDLTQSKDIEQKKEELSASMKTLYDWSSEGLKNEFASVQASLDFIKEIQEALKKRS